MKSIVALDVDVDGLKACIVLDKDLIPSVHFDVPGGVILISRDGKQFTGAHYAKYDGVVGDSIARTHFDTLENAVGWVKEFVKAVA
jgi:hypothetical protein